MAVYGNERRGLSCKLRWEPMALNPRKVCIHITLATALVSKGALRSDVKRERQLNLTKLIEVAGHVLLRS